MGLHPEALRRAVINRLGEDESLAIDQDSEYDQHFLEGVLGILARSRSPRLDKSAGKRLERWCIVLKSGEADELVFTERDELRIGTACLAARSEGVVHLVHQVRVDDLLDAVVVAQSRRAAMLGAPLPA